MILLTFFLICLIASVIAGGLASVSDMRGLTIPNSHSVIIIAAFAAAYAGLWLGSRTDVFSPLLSHILGAVIVFGITAGLFALRTLGAADSKLMTAYAFWMGLAGLPAFLFYLTLAGGALGLTALALKKWKPVKNPKPGGWVARAQAGENKVPYGIAIAVGALASFVKLGYFSPETLGSFLLS